MLNCKMINVTFIEIKISHWYFRYLEVGTSSTNAPMPVYRTQNLAPMAVFLLTATTQPPINTPLTILSGCRFMYIIT